MRRRFVTAAKRATITRRTSLPSSSLLCAFLSARSSSLALASVSASSSLRAARGMQQQGAGLALELRRHQHSPSSSAEHQHYPKDVGIVAMDVYFPSTYVSQADLEVFDKVGPGKYQVGLGQTAMAVCDDNEDINSVCLTAVQSLLEKYGIDPREIGRLDVGTETIVDKSKSVKTVLMDLFQKAGNHNIEGVDTTNACYGGTNALFNAINWVESSYWDGRYALVVAGDIAVYEAGPARPTGGAGVVAMLVGKGAPIVFERGLRSTYMENAWDFYKPIMGSEYPVVDGPVSNTCYLRALDNCFSAFSERFERVHGKTFSLQDDVGFALFHSPYTKLVQKSWARLQYLMAVKDKTHPLHEQLAKEGKLRPETTYDDAPLMKNLLKFSSASYDSKVMPSLTLPMELGNSYCGSLYTGLLSLVANYVETGGGAFDAAKRALMFSYGSGLAASLFSVQLKSAEGLHKIATTSNFKARLAQRKKMSPAEFVEALVRRERASLDDTPKPWVPSGDMNQLFPGTYYLKGVDSKHVRSYVRHL